MMPKENRLPMRFEPLKRVGACRNINAAHEWHVASDLRTSVSDVWRHSIFTGYMLACTYHRCKSSSGIVSGPPTVERWVIYTPQGVRLGEQHVNIDADLPENFFTLFTRMIATHAADDAVESLADLPARARNHAMQSRKSQSAEADLRCRLKEQEQDVLKIEAVDLEIKGLERQLEAAKERRFRLTVRSLESRPEQPRRQRAMG